MRVLFVISGLMIGGAEVQTIRLVNSFARNGHTVGLHILSDKIDKLKEIDQSLVDVVVDPRCRSIDLGVIKRLRDRLINESFDIVVSVLFDSNIYCRLAAIGLKTKIINTERSSNYQLGFKNLFIHRLTRWRVDLLVANSSYGQQHAINYLGYKPKRCTTIWNGIDNKSANMITDGSYPRTALCDLELPASAKLLFVVGTLYPAKDQQLAIQAFAQLHAMDHSWVMIVIGGERIEKKQSLGRRQRSYSRSLYELRDALRLRHAIHFLGPIANVNHLLSRASVLLSTSAYEGFPNVVLEAMQTDVPVVSTQYSDIQQILPFDWQVIDDRCPKKLALGVVRAYIERSRVIAVQHRQLQAKFSTQSMVHQFENVMVNSTPINANALLESNA